MITIGILSLQGDYAAHAHYLNQLNVKHRYVSRPADLDNINGLIIPGGESSVLLRLLTEHNLFQAIQNFNRPILGTCAGAILLAQNVLSPQQPSLQRIAITIERNAYGRQIASGIGQGRWLLTDTSIEMLFIRAPKICDIDLNKVRILAKYQDQPVAVQQDNCIALTFHPELTKDNCIHEHWLKLIDEQAQKN